MKFFNFCSKCARSRVFFSRNIFSAHFVGLLFSYFCRFLLFSLLFRENEGVHCLCYCSGIYFYGILGI